MNKHFCAILISMMLVAGCGHAGSGRTDQQVAADVQSRINADTSFPDKQLNVSASKGVVTLSGNVSSEAARTAAANDAAQVEGVKTVVNNLVVASAPSPDAAAPAAVPQPAQTQVANQTPPQAPIVKAKPSPRVNAHAAKVTQVAATAGASAGSNTGATPQGATSTPAPITPPDFQPDAAAATAATPAPPDPAPQPVTVPSGTQISIRLTNELDSETAQIGDVFRGAISTPIVIDGVTVIPTTADVEGRVVDVKSAGRYAGKSDLVIELTRLLVNGNKYNIATDQWSKAGNSRGKATAAKVGGGAVLGAVLGGIFGGGKGAAIGGAAGAGAGTGAASVGKGQQIILKPETVLNFQLQSSISVVPGTGSHQPLTSSK